MKSLKEYPKRVQRNLQLIEDAFHDPDKHMQQEIRLVVAALRSLDFCVTRAMAGYPDVSWAKSGTPCLDISSPFLHIILEKYNPLPENWWYENKPKSKKIRIEIQQANLEARIELLKLLEEFYRDRHPPVNVRIVFELETGTSDFRLYCQGAKDAALLDAAGYVEWLQSAQAEMQAFAEFLCSRVNQSCITLWHSSSERYSITKHTTNSMQVPTPPELQ